MDKKGNASKFFTVVIIAVAILSIIFSVIGGAVTFETQTDQFTTGLDNNTNMTLTQSDGQVLSSVLNNTGDALDVSNYTDLVTSGVVTLIDNRSIGTGLNVTYTYQQEGYLDNTTVRILVALIPILLAIFLLSKYGKGGK